MRLIVATEPRTPSTAWDNGRQPSLRPAAGGQVFGDNLNGSERAPSVTAEGFERIADARALRASHGR